MKWLKGFYLDEEAPEGAVSLTDEQYEELIAGQAQGLTIEEKDGFPVLVDHRPSEEELERLKLKAKYIPSAMDSVAAFVRSMLKTAPLTDDESKLLVSGVCEDWAPGNYAVGDIRNNMGQTWECHQAHDNAIYPDITPDNPQTWATFWRPLHGKSKETARPWVKPQYGTTDMYHAGEFMVYTDGKIYRCIADTAYSPEEYAQSWEEA